MSIEKLSPAAFESLKKFEKDKQREPTKHERVNAKMLARKKYKNMPNVVCGKGAQPIGIGPITSKLYKQHLECYIS